jgi:hypothetical protein
VSSPRCITREREREREEWCVLLEKLDRVGVKEGERRVSLGGRSRLRRRGVLLGLLGWSVLEALIALLRRLPVEQRTKSGRPAQTRPHTKH